MNFRCKIGQRISLMVILIGLFASISCSSIRAEAQLLVSGDDAPVLTHNLTVIPIEFKAESLDVTILHPSSWNVSNTPGMILIYPDRSYFESTYILNPKVVVWEKGAYSGKFSQKFRVPVSTIELAQDLFDIGIRFGSNELKPPSNVDINGKDGVIFQTGEDGQVTSTVLVRVSLHNVLWLIITTDEQDQSIAEDIVNYVALSLKYGD